MNRRGFVRVAGGAIFAPVYGRWFREGSGLLVPEAVTYTVDFSVPWGTMVALPGRAALIGSTAALDTSLWSVYARLRDKVHDDVMAAFEGHRLLRGRP